MMQMFHNRWLLKLIIGLYSGCHFWRTVIRLISLGMVTVLLAGCAAGPEFRRPEVKPVQWHSPLPHGGKLAGLAHWWEQLNDPLLNQLILEAEKNNPSIDMALARMHEARANANLSGAGLYPVLMLEAGSNRSRNVFGTQIFEQTAHKLSFDASWELDLFGSNRRSAQAAEARFGAEVAGWHEARISLAAEVARVYTGMRQCEAALSIAQQLQQSHAVVLALTLQKQSAGLASSMDRLRAEAASADADSAYLARQGECARGYNQLAMLTGIEQSVLQVSLIKGVAVIPVPYSVDISSIAAQFVRQRPDVAGAEWRLAAASAEIGVATAALYPSLILSGSVALNRVTMSGQSAQVPTWSFGPALSFPLFTAGRGQAGVAAAQARYDYALANYQKSVREAIQEVEDALVRLNMASLRVQKARQSQGHNQQLLTVTQARNTTGLANQLVVEDARRNFLQSQDLASQQDQEIVLAWIALYKALGGGWDEQASQGLASGGQHE